MHTSNERHLWKLATRHEPPIERLNYWIAACGRGSSHIQHCADSGPATPNSTLAPHLTTVSIQWSYPYQRGDRFVVQRAQFRQVRYQRRGEDRPDSRYPLGRSSRSRQSGLSRNTRTSSRSVCLRRVVSHATCSSISARMLGETPARRLRSAVSISTSWRRRAISILSAWVWVSAKRRTAGRTASAKCARTRASMASVLASWPVALPKSHT